MTSVPSSQPERYCPTCERSFHSGPRCPDDDTELVVLSSGPDPLIGRSLNERYTIVERLGAGGMGTVYVGKQHSVGREVAIKVVNAALVSDSDVVKRFLREAKLASRLSHPNAVSILDFGQTPDGLFFLAMELLQGRTLDKVLRLEGRVRLPRVVRIAGQICEALQGAHKIAIVHRDLKPANVMLLEGTEGRDLIKVLDFGLAKSLSPNSTSTTMTMSGALLGTPAYMSPEAARGGEVDERTDLYSLGCMLYVLASGRLPFQSDNIHELLSMHTNLAPPPLTMVPKPVNGVIMKLLAKDPGDRFRTAASTRHALEEAALPFLSSELETAVASTLPGRKKSMPPVRASANTIESIPPVDAPSAAPSDASVDAPVDAIAPSEPSAAVADTIAPVAFAPAVTPVNAATPVSTTPIAARATPRRSMRIVAIAGIGLALALGVVIQRMASQDPGEPPPQRPAIERRAPAMAPTAITPPTPSATPIIPATPSPAPVVTAPPVAMPPADAPPTTPAGSRAGTMHTVSPQVAPARPVAPAKPIKPVETAVPAGSGSGSGSGSNPHGMPW